MLPNFSWVVRGRLAGLASPAGAYGGSAALEERLEELRAAGVGALISLSESPLDRVAIAGQGLRYLHLPVADMTAPGLEDLERAVEFAASAQGEGMGVAAHCQAGLGRTGTFLACCLVREGLAAEAAISEVRRLRPGSVETADQERAVHAYAVHRRAQDGA